MSPLRPSKRQRLNNASSTLSKPFKSPLKTPLAPKSTNTAETAPSTPITKSQPTTAATPLSSTSPPPLPHPPSVSTPLRHPNSTYNHSSSDLLTLQKRHTHLLNALSHARATLETSTQAFAIETSPRDAELTLLVQKWRVASRTAAEEVFAGARDRVNKMGGLKGMRERERLGRENGWGWDGNNEKAYGGGREEDEEDGAGFGAKDEREDDREEVDEREEGVEKVEEVDEEGGYTMDMMLKSLNIELGVVGFNKGLQKWVD